jgi:hypothetical protein
MWIAAVSAALGMESCRAVFSATAGVLPIGHSAVFGLALFAAPFVIGGFGAAVSYHELVRLKAWLARRKDRNGANFNALGDPLGFETRDSESQPALRESRNAAWLGVAFIIVAASAVVGAGIGGFISLAFGADRTNVIGSMVGLGFMGSVLGVLIAIPAAVTMKFMNRDL